MIRIEYRVIGTEDWQTLEIEKSYFKRGEPMDDELVAEEINELFYASVDFKDDEDVRDKLEFKKGDYWNDVVIPIYEQTQLASDDEDDDPFVGLGFFV